MVLLLRALRNTTFYEDSDFKIDKNAGFTKEELVMGRLLYKIRLIKDMNAHPIWGVELDPKDITNVGTEQIGQGLFTAIASFFNSDCNPNTIRINLGKKMFLVAWKNIRKGEEITDNYCIHFSDMPALERREWIEVDTISSSSNKKVFYLLKYLFQDYFKFRCECVACEDDWPTYNRMSSDRPSEKVSDGVS